MSDRTKDNRRVKSRSRPMSTRPSSGTKLSAGILAFRHTNDGIEVLLVHPGGPFWRNKDGGAWSIPKGEIGANEDPEVAARREFTEELGPSAIIGSLRSGRGHAAERKTRDCIRWRGGF